ncbi:hypothetical protein FOC4_g10000280 [Fusarium odoratissimum]|uniref:Uncharacterized protein n=2 Tax=Fusarium oxysporum species complex TaxID=171631 RepID=N1S6V6_FUSC4|nr:hypothetical protein FOC4_g10000280 [Fusarium odoratissimum]TXC06105.1 hypothetical protein FocTR4_00009472 [Fusarium oxysporum f. sp. cubense]
MHSLPPDVTAENKGPAIMAVIYSFTALSSVTLKKKLALSIALGFGAYIEINSVIIAACIQMLLPFLKLLFAKRFLSAPYLSSLSRVSDARPGSRMRNLRGTNKLVEIRQRRTSDKVEERMEAVLLLEEPGRDKESGQN